MALSHFKAAYFKAAQFIALVGQQATGTCLYDSSNDYDAPIAYAPAVCDLPAVAVCGYDTSNTYDNEFEFDAAVCATDDVVESGDSGANECRGKGRSNPWRDPFAEPDEDDLLRQVRDKWEAIEQAQRRERVDDPGDTDAEREPIGCSGQATVDKVAAKSLIVRQSSPNQDQNERNSGTIDRRRQDEESLVIALLIA